MDRCPTNDPGEVRLSAGRRGGRLPGEGLELLDMAVEHPSRLKCRSTRRRARAPIDRRNAGSPSAATSRSASPSTSPGAASSMSSPSTGSPRGSCRAGPSPPPGAPAAIDSRVAVPRPDALLVALDVGGGHQVRGRRPWAPLRGCVRRARRRAPRRGAGRRRSRPGRPPPAPHRGAVASTRGSASTRPTRSRSGITWPIEKMTGTSSATPIIRRPVARSPPRTQTGSTPTGIGTSSE